MKSELIIEATVDNLVSVHSFIHQSIEKLNFSNRTLMQLDLVVEEIFVNIASYAYSPNVGLAKILVNIETVPSAIEITFIDSGVPYNPLDKSDPNINLSAEEREIGGLGIFLTKNLVDDISYQYIDGQNVLQLTISNRENKTKL